MRRELWDAYDREGNLLGFDLVRGEPCPDDVYHLVAEVYAVTHDGRILVTQRHPDKICGFLWEVTGGSVVKGESAPAGAIRELREETGIVISREDLHPVCITTRHYPGGYPTIQHGFMIFFDPSQQEICLQEGETVDWKLLPYEEFKRFILTEEFMPSIRHRFLANQEKFDRLIAGHTNVK